MCHRYRLPQGVGGLGATGGSVGRQANNEGAPRKAASSIPASLRRSIGGHTKAGLDKRVVPEQELNAVVKRVAAKWKGADGDAIRPVDTPDRLPQKVLDSADEQNMPHDEIKGVFHEGHIYPLARTRPARRKCVSCFSNCVSSFVQIC